jgi:HEPN domain-containing protein
MTAKQDLQAAELLFSANMFAHACFQAQQAGEKALKAIWRAEDADPWGHSVKRLVVEFPGKAKIADLRAWTDAAALLDKFYIPTRYPNGLPDLTPHDIYGAEDGRLGIQAAALLVSGCQKWLQND